MQVNSCNRNQISFGSKRIIPVIVKDMNDMPVKAWFSRLKLSDPVDLATMEKVNNHWNSNDGANFAYDIYDEFMFGISTYAIELDSDKKLYDKLLCLGTTNHWRKLKKFTLEHIQAAPNSCFEAPENRQYKGAGTALMYGVLKTVQKKHSVNKFELTSMADGFYRHLGMKSTGRHRYFDKEGLIDFLQRQKAEFKTLIQKAGS